MSKYQTYLIFGAPGSGKGTQGRVLGKVPGYYHCACGDVFRALDLRTPLEPVHGQACLHHTRPSTL